MMCAHCGCDVAKAPSEISQRQGPSRRINLRINLLQRNDQQALQNRIHFQRHGLLAVNLLSAPGSGKTAFLEQLSSLWSQQPIGVIVGDLATDNDAQRLAKAGAKAVQIRTGDRCHLDAALVANAFTQLNHNELTLLMIENVGNLVCPAAFDLGEQLRIVLLSVTEGEDKPLKYPALFKSADAVLINKIDLADVVGFDRNAAIANLETIAPQAKRFEVSARTGQGMKAVMQWLTDELQH